MLTVECRECQRVVAELSGESLIPMLAQAVALCSHATQPHYSHQLIVRHNGVELSDLKGNREVRFECMDHACSRKDEGERASVFRVPDWLIGAAALAHHSGHEGHKFAIVVDGVRVWPRD